MHIDNLVLTTFKDFYNDEEAKDMFVTGPAGTGKTTDLSYSINYCIENSIPYVVCAHTHTACDILRGKLAVGARVQTLHSYLCKRPLMNSDAVNIKRISNSVQTGDADEEIKVLFLDERSIVGLKDGLTIEREQLTRGLKVVWIGDDNQLPPVGDAPAIDPYGDYCVKLTKQYRNDNPLQQVLTLLIAYIGKEAEPQPLQPVPGYFERGADLVKAYKACTTSKVVLAYTNRKVQWLNQQIEGKYEPTSGDLLFSPTAHRYFTFIDWVPPQKVRSVTRHYTDEPLELNTKYKTLEFLIDSNSCNFATVEDEEGAQFVVATVFGTSDYLMAKKSLEFEAVNSNKKIQALNNNIKPTDWARQNSTHKLARARGKAWRDCLSFNDCVIGLDFVHAMTVHKSQGSTFETVFVDTDDIAGAMHTDFTLYLKLLYVAISRASKKVVTT